jgi:hypothetical protein
VITEEMVEAGLRAILSRWDYPPVQPDRADVRAVLEAAIATQPIPYRITEAGRKALEGK